MWNQAKISLYVTCELWPSSGASVVCEPSFNVFVVEVFFLVVSSPGLTCRRNTILLASCISFSSCSWWASSCSSQDFSSSCPLCPREGHNPHRDTSSERKGGTGEMGREGVFFSLVASSTRVDVQPTNLWQISSLSAQICHPEFPPGSPTDHGLFLL